MASFPFEDLAQELEDEIIDHTLLPEEYDISSSLLPKIQRKGKDGDDQVINGDDPQQSDDAMDVGEGPVPPQRPPLGLIACVRYRADCNLMCVSRSLYEACKKRATSWKTLVLKDSDSYNFHLIALPVQVTGVLWLELCLILFCHSCPFMSHESEGHCRATSEVLRHKSWVEDVLEQLPHLRAVTILVHLAHSDFTPGQKTELPCEKLVERKLQELKELPNVKELIFYRYKFEEEQHLEGPKDLVYRWKPETVDSVDRADFQ